MAQMEDPNRVMLGADKRCWPPPLNPAECVDILASPLPAEVYGPGTDSGAELPHVRPVPPPQPLF